MLWLLSRLLWPAKRANWWLSVPMLLGLVCITLAFLPFTRVFDSFNSKPDKIAAGLEGCKSSDRAFDLAIGADENFYISMSSSSLLEGDSHHQIFGKEREITGHRTLDPIEEQIEFGTEFSKTCPYFFGSVIADNPNIKVLPREVRLVIGIEEKATNDGVVQALQNLGYLEPGLFQTQPITFRYDVNSRSGLYYCNSRGGSNSDYVVLYGSSDSPDLCINEMKVLEDPRTFFSLRRAIDQLTSDYSLRQKDSLDENEAKNWQIVSDWVSENLDAFNEDDITRLRDLFKIKSDDSVVQILQFQIDCKSCLSDIRKDFNIEVEFDQLNEGRTYLASNFGYGFLQSDLTVSDGKVLFKAANAKGIFTKDFFLFVGALLAGVGFTLVVEVLIVFLHRLSFPDGQASETRQPSASEKSLQSRRRLFRADRRTSAIGGLEARRRFRKRSRPSDKKTPL